MESNGIKAWLEDPHRNYFDGISLFERFGTNLTLVFNLRRARTKTNEAILVYELNKIAAALDKKNQPAPDEELHPAGDLVNGLNSSDGTGSPVTEVVETETTKHPVKSILQTEKEPLNFVKSNSTGNKNSDLLQGLLDSRIGKYAERNVLSDTLADLEGEALKSGAIRVQKIDDEIIALTTQIQFVEQHGHLPVPKFDAAEDLESFKKKKKSLGEKLSRLKKELKTTPGNLKKEAQVEDIISQIAALDLKIKALTQTTS